MHIQKGPWLHSKHTGWARHKWLFCVPCAYAHRAPPAVITAGKKLEAVESQVSSTGRMGRFMAGGGKKGEQGEVGQPAAPPPPGVRRAEQPLAEPPCTILPPGGSCGGGSLLQSLA